MKTCRFFLTFALLCFSAAVNLLLARSAEATPLFQPTVLSTTAQALPAFDIAIGFCLGAVLLWTMFWVSVLKMARLEIQEA